MSTARPRSAPGDRDVPSLLDGRPARGRRRRTTAGGRRPPSDPRPHLVVHRRAGGGPRGAGLRSIAAAVAGQRLAARGLLAVGPVEPPADRPPADHPATARARRAHRLRCGPRRRRGRHQPCPGGAGRRAAARHAAAAVGRGRRRPARDGAGRPAHGGLARDPPRRRPPAPRPLHDRHRGRPDRDDGVRRRPGRRPGGPAGRPRRRRPRDLRAPRPAGRRRARRGAGRARHGRRPVLHVPHRDQDRGDRAAARRRRGRAGGAARARPGRPRRPVGGRGRAAPAPTPTRRRRRGARGAVPVDVHRADDRRRRLLRRDGGERPVHRLRRELLPALQPGLHALHLDLLRPVLVAGRGGREPRRPTRTGARAGADQLVPPAGLRGPCPSRRARAWPRARPARGPGPGVRGVVAAVRHGRARRGRGGHERDREHALPRGRPRTRSLGPGRARRGRRLVRGHRRADRVRRAGPAARVSPRGLASPRRGGPVDPPARGLRRDRLARRTRLAGRVRRRLAA